MAILKMVGRPTPGAGFETENPGDTARVPGIVETDAGQVLTLRSASGTTGLLGSSFNIDNTFVLGTVPGGNINLPNNGSAQFQIEGTSVSANVTAANLGTLTAGPASNADALHTHAGLNGGGIHFSAGVFPGFGAPAVGELGYVQSGSANEAQRALATAMSTAVAVGAYQGVTDTLSDAPQQSLLFVSGLTLASGDAVYVSKTPGKATNDISAYSTGDVEFEVGRVLDPTGYPGSLLVPCVWAPKVPIQL